MIGTTLAHYEITAKIGEGGMGEVYRARDTKLGREVAIKVLPDSVTHSADRLARFEREARTLASVNHPNIVTIYAVEEVGDVRLLTMELVEGTSLRELIRSERLSLRRFFEISLPMIDAVSAAHERGIVHRDLKPGNVMVSREGRVKVLDFGLAKAGVIASDETLAPDEDTVKYRAQDALTAEGTIVGTVAYMSPEQVRGDHLDSRSDVFSLGIVLYEMATGARPFSGDSAVDVISSILRDTPTPVTSIRGDVPPSLGRIIDRCLAKHPGDRYQTARAVHDDLHSLESGVSPAVVAGGPVSASPSASALPSADAEEGFWVAVLPFQFRGAASGLDALAEDMSEDILTGLSRFSYLRVISRSLTSRYAGERADVRTLGRELGARYVMEGSVRQAGATIRIAAQLVDSVSGANLWAETYDRAFDPEKLIEVVDDVVPRIVSTVAEMHGVLTHTMSEALRNRDPDELTPYEAVLRSFGYVERLTADEHVEARACLEKAVERAPKYADALAMLSFVCAEEFKHGFNERPGSLDRALDAARKAVAAAPSNHLCHHVLAQALFFRRELDAFRTAAQRAVELNPMDGATVAFMGILMAYAGDWDHGCALAARAMELNPNHPGWYRFSFFFNAYRKMDYQGALDVALRINLPSYFYTHAALAMAYGQLGDLPAARRALDELLSQKPDFAKVARAELAKWHRESEYVESLLDGLRKAGLAIE